MDGTLGKDNDRGIDMVKIDQAEAERIHGETGFDEALKGIIAVREAKKVEQIPRGNDVIRRGFKTLGQCLVDEIDGHYRVI